jgi:hypothetical protein
LRVTVGEDVDPYLEAAIMAIPANRCEAAASGAERETDLDVDDLYNLGERLGASRTLERIPPA